MPANYAHYRFAAQLLPGLDAALLPRVRRQRQLYDVGSHGPDLFFYYNPFFSTAIGDLGYDYHALTGKAFFSRCARQLRLNPSEGAVAYLYGVLAHFTLDSICHPFITATAALGKIGHTQLETEFDRYLLTLDGKKEPCFYDDSRHMALKSRECAVISRFYPPAKPHHIRSCIRSMARITRFTASRNRKLVGSILNLGGDTARQMLMPLQPDPDCAHLDETLMNLYDQALGHYPSLARQLDAHLTCGAPLGPEFDVTFG